MPNLLVDGQILLFGDVGDPFGWGDGFTPTDVAMALAEHGPGDVTVRINSPGGNAVDGVAIYSLLRAHSGEVTTVVDGIAASAASLIFMAGAKREIRQGAMVMIHDVMTRTFGNAAEHIEAGGVLDKVSDQYAEVYARQSGMEASALRALMQAETWMSADEAVTNGLATAKLADEAVAKAAFDWKLYAHAPGGLPSRVKESTPPKAEASAQPGERKMAGEKPAPADKPADDKHEPVAKAWAVDAYTMAAGAGLDLVQTNEMVAKVDNMEAFKAALIDFIAAERTKNLPAPVGGKITIDADGTDKFRAGVTQAFLAQEGIEKRDAKNEFNGMRPMDIIRAVAQHLGIKFASHDPMKMVAAVITHTGSDFSQIISNIAEKSMLKGFEETEETFEAWTSTGTLPDFKIARRVDLNALPSLPIVPEAEEYTYLTTGERGETYSLATAGGLFSISRQAIINDDANVFSKVPRKLGRAAKRTIGNDVYGVLINNPNMGDGNALFHAASHKNLFTGAGSALSATSLQAADLAMSTQTDRSNPKVVLGLTPRHFIGPRALKYTALQLLHSSAQIGQANPAVTNPVQNMVESTIFEARLDQASATAWYLAADQNSTDTVEVLYLNGVREPVLEEHQTVTVDGLFYKIRIDYGVKAFAWEGLSKSAGA